MERKFSLIIAASGNSTRFKENKLFINIHQKPIIQHTIECFEKIEEINEIIIATKEIYIKKIKEISKHMSKKIIIINGGETRTESVRIAFTKCKKDQPILIHDGARPNVKKELIKRVLSTFKKHNTVVVPGIKTTDTIKEIKNDKITKTINRKNIISVQTPQLFSYNILKEIYQTKINNEATDEASLCNGNIEQYWVNGDENNIKLTFPKDKLILEKELKGTNQEKA